MYAQGLQGHGTGVDPTHHHRADVPPDRLSHEAELGVGHEVLGAKVNTPTGHRCKVQRLLDLLLEVVLNPIPGIKSAGIQRKMSVVLRRQMSDVICYNLVVLLMPASYAADCPYPAFYL